MTIRRRSRRWWGRRLKFIAARTVRCSTDPTRKRCREVILSGTRGRREAGRREKNRQEKERRGKTYRREHRETEITEKDPEKKGQKRESGTFETVSDNDLIYDWNTVGGLDIPHGRRVLLNDETLRDGLQNPSVVDPSSEDKLRILHLIEALGIDAVNIGLPGAGPRAVASTEALAREIARARLKIRPNCAARTHENDIRPIVEISQRAGIAIEAATFLGSSPVRRLVEEWTVDHLERTTEKAVKLVVENGLPSMYVTEDTIRTDPGTVKRLDSTASRNGARAIVLCDTVGHATPNGAFNLVKFVVNAVVKPSTERIRVDWHGHNDRGLSIANSLAAIAAGAHQVHAAANALGERVGNTPMELMLVNLRLMGLIQQDLSRLKE